MVIMLDQERCEVLQWTVDSVQIDRASVSIAVVAVLDWEKMSTVGQKFYVGAGVAVASIVDILLHSF